jgi:hypothetical protein
LREGRWEAARQLHLNPQPDVEGRDARILRGNAFRNDVPTRALAQPVFAHAVCDADTANAFTK